MRLTISLWFSYVWLVMDGFRGFKFWVALRRHFTEKEFDAIQNGGRIKGSYEAYLKRLDMNAIEFVCSHFKEPEFVLYLAGNFIYGNAGAMWDYGQGVANYNLFVGRRKKIGMIIINDLQTLKNYNVKVTDGVSVIRLMTRGNITIETVIVLNHFHNLTNQLRKTPAGSMLEPLLIRVDKGYNFLRVPEKLTEKLKEMINGTNI